MSEAERGKGYGRTLMEKTELYARSRGFKRLCLTTHDKQNFYAHLGYVLSTPVQNAGAMTAFIPMETLLRFSRMPSEETSVQTQTKMHAQGDRDSEGGCAVRLPPSFSLPTPPPPPPPPPTIPCPPPPPQCAGQCVVQTLTETPYRDAKGLPIYWMHKDI